MILAIVSVLLLSNTTKFILNCNSCNTSGTIYIRGDGSIEPFSAPISNIDNVTYIFTDNIKDSIVIEKDNITLDGKGHTLQGTANGTGINLPTRNNVTIKNMQIENFTYGLYIQASSNIILFNDTIRNNTWDGIYAVSTFTSITYGNDISANKRYGIVFSESGNNRIFHNNFVQNTENHVHLFGGFPNVWDDGYPSGGNYWYDYTGTDFYNGLFQNDTGSDGVIDASYTLDEYNQDSYPLAAPINLFDAGLWNDESYMVEIVTNSSVSNFHLNTEWKTVSFNVTSETSSGFCRITVPNTIIQDMWQDNYTILVDGNQPPYIRNWTQEVSTYIYFTYPYSNHEIIIIPELQSMAQFLCLVFAVIAIIIAKKTIFKKNFRNW